MCVCFIITLAFTKHFQCLAVCPFSVMRRAKHAVGSLVGCAAQQVPYSDPGGCKTLYKWNDGFYVPLFGLLGFRYATLQKKASGLRLQLELVVGLGLKGLLLDLLRLIKIGLVPFFVFSTFSMSTHSFSSDLN